MICIFFDCPKVKSHSIYCLTQLLNEVEIVSVSNKKVFPDYILPALHKIVQDEYALGRTTMTKHLPSLSQIVLKFLNTCPATAKSKNSENLPPPPKRTRKIWVKTRRRQQKQTAPREAPLQSTTKS